MSGTAVPQESSGEDFKERKSSPQESSGRAREQPGRHAAPIWSPAAGVYYHRVHEWARALLASSRRPGSKPLERQLLDVRCYDVTRVARALSDVEVKEATGFLLEDKIAIFWRQLTLGGTSKGTLWHALSTPNLEEHHATIARIRNPEPPRRRVEALDPDPAIAAAEVPPLSVPGPSPRPSSPETRPSGEKALDDFVRREFGKA